MEVLRVRSEEDPPLERLGREREWSYLGWSVSASTWIHLIALALLLWFPWSQRRPLDLEPKSDPVAFDVKREPKKPPPPREESPTLREPRAARPPDAPPPEPMPFRTPPASAPPSFAPSAPSAPPPGNVTPPPSGRDPRGEQGPAPGNPPPGPGLGGGGSPPRNLRESLRDFRRYVPSPGERGGGKEDGEGGGAGSGRFEAPGIPSSGFGFRNLEFETRDFDWLPYSKQIYYAILRAWYSRLFAGASAFEKWGFARGDWSLDHGNAVRFVIRRSGQVIDVAIEKGSGCEPLDASSVDALREVVLPPLPDEFPKDEEVVHVRFVAFGDVRLIRDDPQLRSAYYGR